MPLTKIGINLTGLNNVTTPSFDLKNTSTKLINDIPIKANEITNGLYGLITLVALFFYLMWKLNQEPANEGDYGYGAARSVGIASSVCSIIGLYALNLGYFVNFYHVMIFIVVSFIAVGIVYKSSN